ncbi:hypothetical protein Tco_1163991 [Tanacetum coccineum]
MLSIQNSKSDSIGKYMLEIILHQQRTLQLLKQKKLMQTQEYHSNPILALNVDSLKVDLVVIQNTCSEKEDSNSKTTSSKSVKESSLNSETKDVHAIKYKMSKAKERCMAYFQSLHSHLQVLSKDDLKGTRIEHGFKQAFMSLFGQDVDTFMSTMLLNVDQLQKQLDKDEFQEDRSMEAFWVVNNQFQKFINLTFTLDYDSQMTDKYFVEYTGIEVKHFRDTLLQYMGNVKKSVTERTRHQRHYERRVNKRQMQTQESKIDTGKAVDNGLVVMESNGTESDVQDDNSRSGNDTDADDADIRPIYDKEPMAEYPEQCQVKSPMLNSSLDNQTTEYSKQSLESENILLKKTVAQFQKDFSRMKAHCIALELKCQNQSLKSGQHGQILNETSNKAKIKKEIDVLETMNIKLEHSVAKLRKENETLKKHYKDLYDSIKITISKTIEQTTSLLANNVDLKAQVQEKVFAIAALKNDLRKLKGNSVDTKFQCTVDDSKPKPRSNNQTPRSLPLSKSSCVTITAVPKANHSKSPSSFSDSKQFVCSTCHKCVFNANHDACITKLLKEIFTRHRFSPNKTSDVYEKTSPRANLRWKPTGRSFKSVGLRWIPTGKLFDSCTSKDDSEPSLSLNVDISNIHESKQTLDLSVGTSTNVQKEQSLDLSAATLCNVNKENLRVWLLKKLISQKPSSAVTTADASDKRQQQPDSTSSTSTLATSVTANGNFDLSYALSWKPYQGDSLNLPDHKYSIYTLKRETEGLDDGVAASF